MSTIELGGNIRLTGFSDMDNAKMVVVKKIVGNYARRFSDLTKNLEFLSLTIKPVHRTDAGRIFELHAKLMDNGTPIVAESSDRNIFVAIDSALKKVENGISR